MAKKIETPEDFVAGSITQFRNSVVDRGGVQFANRYVVDFITPYGTFSTYPSEINIPQRALATYSTGQPESLWGTKRKIPIQHEFDEITMAFVLYQDFTEKNFFDSWMDNIINRGSYNDNLTENANVYFDYVGKVYITTFASGSQATNLDDGITSRTLLDEAYPLNLLPIQMSSENTGYTTFVLTLAFRNSFNLLNG